MKKVIKSLLILFTAFSICSLPCLTGIASATTLGPDTTPAPPIIITPTPNQSFTTSDIDISGTSQNNTQVEIYVDDRLDGVADVLNQSSGNGTFSYQKNFSLTNGYHTIMVRAVNKLNRNLISDFASVGIKIVSYQSPTLLEPEGDITTDRPIIKGVAPNSAFIEIFIDGLYYDTIQAGTHASGTAGFTYSPLSNLSFGDHMVYVIAESPDGTKRSEKSNTLEFRIVSSDGTVPTPTPTPTPVPPADDLPYPAPPLL